MCSLGAFLQSVLYASYAMVLLHVDLQMGPCWRLARCSRSSHNDGEHDIYILEHFPRNGTVLGRLGLNDSTMIHEMLCTFISFIEYHRQFRFNHPHTS